VAELRVERYQDGAFRHIGTLASSGRFQLDFTYADEYRQRADAVTLSLSLPLDQASYDIERTLPYFEGLLPEGPALESIAH